MFDYPFPLRAHLKFKCAYAADIKTYNPKESLAQGKSDLFDTRDSYFKESKPALITNINNNNNNSMFSLPAKRHIEESDDSAASPAKLMRSPLKEKHRSVSSLKYSIEELSKSSTVQKCETLSVVNGHDACAESSNASAFRKVGRASIEKSERLISPSDERNSSVYSSYSAADDRSTPPSSNGSLSSPTSTSSSPYSSLGPLNLPAVHSPMVQGSPPSSPRQFPQHSPSASMPPPPRPPLKSGMPSPSSPSSSSHYEDSTLARGPSIMGLYMPRIPMFPPPSVLGIPRPSMLSQPGSSSPSTSSTSAAPSPRGIPLQHSGFPADQIPPGLLEMCRATIPTVGPLTESFAANIRNSETLAKQALFADRHISSLGFLKSSNPMVEKLLQSTNPTLLSSPINALNLSQNWCAKCNATFRMTSDLVYHMR